MRHEYLQRLDRWPAYLGVGILVVTPFVSSEKTLDPVLLPRLIILSAATMLLGIFLWLTQSKSDELPSGMHGRTLVYALFGYLMFAALSISAALAPSEAVMETAKVALLVSLVVVFTIILQRDRPALGLFARGLTTVAVCLAAIGLGQYYNVAFEGYVRSGGLANRNLLASALCLLLPFVLYVILQGGIFWRRFALAAIVPTVAMIMLTNSRAIWFAVVLATVCSIGGWLVLSRNARISLRQQSKWKRRAVAALLVAAATAVLFSMPVFRQAEQESVIDRAMTVSSFKQGSVAERLAMWGNSLAMFSDHPLLGVGAGNWKLISPAYGPIAERQLTDNTMFQRPHNDYLWILSESGIFALICYLAVLIAALVYAIRTIRTATDPDDVAISYAMLFGLVLFLIISFFSYPKERMVHTMLLALMTATVVAVSHANSSVRRSGRSKLLLVVAIVIALPSFIIGLIRLQSSSHIVTALQARNTADWPLVVQEVDQASSWYVQLDHTATPLIWYRGVANFSMNRHDDALADFREALRVHPNHHHVLNNLASSYELKQMHDSAIFYYRRALEIAPGFEEAAINLAAVYYNDERYKEALETLRALDQPVVDPRFERYMERIRGKLAGE